MWDNSRVLKNVEDLEKTFPDTDLHIAVSLSIAACNKMERSKLLEISEYDVCWTPMSDTRRENALEYMGFRDSSIGIPIPKLDIANEFTNDQLRQFFNGNPTCINYGCDNQGFIQTISALYPKVDLRLIADRKVWDSKGDLVDIMLEKRWDWLSETGIERVIFIDKEGKENELFVSGKTGRTLHWYSPFPLSNSDIIRAQLLAELPIGVTGNASLSEAFSLRKLPFYNYRHILDNLWTALRDYATKLQLNDLEQYFAEMHNMPTAVDITRLTPDLLKILQEQWEILSDHLNKNKNMEKSFLSLVYQRLLQEDLYFKEKFSQIQDAITMNSISEEQGLLNLRCLLEKVVSPCDSSATTLSERVGKNSAVRDQSVLDDYLNDETIAAFMQTLPPFAKDSTAKEKLQQIYSAVLEMAVLYSCNPLLQSSDYKPSLPLWSASSLSRTLKEIEKKKDEIKSVYQLFVVLEERNAFQNEAYYRMTWTNDVMKNAISISAQMNHLTLREIDVSNSDLTALPDMHRFQYVESLDISNTNIEQIPKLPLGLKKLDVSGTKITQLPDNLPYLLKVLNLNGCQLADQPYNLLPRYLEDLYIDGQHLQDEKLLPYKKSLRCILSHVQKVK